MKTALVTGGSRGIGREIVRLFSSSGYLVAFTYKNSDSEALSLAKETGSLAVYADSAREEDVTAAVGKAVDSLGKIDCLINNAGISSFAMFDKISTYEWNRIMSVNLNGAFLYAKAVLPGMITRHSGRIINVSSMWGITGSSCEVAYSSSKAALNGMTKALAKEVGPAGITVNAIAPGLIDTDMNSCISNADISRIIEDTPMMRIGTPRDVAALALFLAGDDASFITGQIISVNGGYLI